MRVNCSARFSLCREDVQQDNGHSSNLDHGKWYSVSEDSPQGEWDRIAEQMILTFAESTHPVFLSTSLLSRGVLKSKEGGKLSIHYCADQGTIQTAFRTIISVNQISLYGTVSDCVKNMNFITIEHGVLLWQDNPTHRSCQVWQRHTYLWPMILHKMKIYCEDIWNELKSYHNRTGWLNFVWMQDSWPQL